MHKVNGLTGFLKKNQKLNSTVFTIILYQLLLKHISELIDIHIDV